MALFLVFGLMNLGPGTQSRGLEHRNLNKCGTKSLVYLTKTRLICSTGYFPEMGCNAV